MMAFLEEFKHLKIRLEDIKLATDNFGDDNLIGSGGFGKVYRGVISHSKGRSIVAFKRLDPRYGQGNSEFWKEIMMLSRYTHENLVALLGYCDEDGEKILVYEYASCGSLDHHLGATALTWRRRLKICLSAVKGLVYLHDHKGTQQRVLHRDIKSSNILLDENWNAKVSDFGLSKIGPANQQHTVLVSNVVGTLGYLDPLYMEMGILTKESDVYSFGVVLFEILCGRVCFENSNGRFQSLVRMWKQSYKQNKLGEIIFQDLMQQMDSRSLEMFSDIAFQCLQKSREKRPTMALVMEKLKTALDFQEIYEDGEHPMDYTELISTVVPPLIYNSSEELNMLLSKGVFLNNGNTWFSLNENGEHCELISAAECVIPYETAHMRNGYSSEKDSRFVGGCYLAFDGKIRTYVRTQFLSPKVTYTINLVFKFIYQRTLSEQTYSVFKYKLDGEVEPSFSYSVYEREDGWLMAELYEFTSDARIFDHVILFEGSYALAVEGIEFKPREKVKHEVLEDEEVDMQSISGSDADWEHKLPNNYDELIKWSKDTVQWTTKKELYFLLCSGFLINDGKEWFSLAKNGKKCHMLSARAALLEDQWSWESLPQSRFGEVAVLPCKSFSIVCTIESEMLSPQTTYAAYLVYRVTKTHCELEAPMKVKYKDFHSNEWKAFKSIHLVSPEIPVIGRKVNQSTHYPQNRAKMKGVPQLRNDGWMEVLVWEFITGSTTHMIPVHVDLTSSFDTLIEGLIVQGIEFKPNV